MSAGAGAGAGAGASAGARRTRGRTLALVLVWTLPSAVFLAATAIVYTAFRIPPPDRLDAGERAAVMATLRAALDDQPAVPCPVRRAAAPVAATVWLAGRPIARVDGEGADRGADLGAAVDAAAAQLRALPAIRAIAPAERAAARIQVDIITGTAPLGGDQWLFDALAVPGIGEMLAINSGLEGIGVRIDGKPWLLLPHELVAARVLTTKRPSKQMQDFVIGPDLTKMNQMLAQRAGKPGVLDPTTMFRFRTDTFVEGPRAPVEGPQAPPLQLYRGIPPPVPLTGKLLRERALEGGRFLVAHLAENGRYIYEHDLASGVQTDPRSASYSMPRHAGTTYFLAELYRITKEPWLREPIERAFAHLAELMGNGRCAGRTPAGIEFDCVMDRHEKIAQMGSTALAVVALAEYQRATGDPRYLPLAKKLAAWIQWMQRPDGSFRHLYNPTTRLPDDQAQLLYYSGEATLALARMHVVTGDPAYARAAEQGLDWLVGWYDFFMGGFFYGEEHWTCIAAEAAYPAVKNGAHVDFCHGYGAFLREQQAAPGEHPDEDDFAGGYAFTPFLVPFNTPAGSRTEAMISAYLLGRHHGRPDPAVRRQIRNALQYVLGQQITPENDFAVVGPGRGGVPGSPIDRNVRIDFVQHVCSAFIRASEWIDDP
ncbi:MAG TPA: hypothetical protein VNO30_26355 [Kofleriaceae bacterium]|nr:hypothetical protein [Kofleriaceae bacterium]